MEFIGTVIESIVKMFIKLFSYVTNFLEKKGFFAFLKTLFALIIVILVIFLSYKAFTLKTDILEVINDKKEEEIITHDEAMVERRNIQGEVDMLNSQLLSETMADRVFILEFHNGVSNSSGLPFLFAEMTYSADREGILSMDEEYQQLNMTRFSFFNKIIEEQYWSGSVEEVRKFDKKFANKLEISDVKYISIVVLNGTNNVLGFLGVVYCGNYKPMDNIKQQKIIYKHSQKLTTFLDSGINMKQEENIDL